MSDVFVSYAREDASIAERLARALESLGWSVFVDRSAIPPGVHFDDFIQQALEDARCVVVLWSRAAVASRWVKDESSTGLDRNVLVSFALEDGLSLPLRFKNVNTPRLPDVLDPPDTRSMLELVGRLRHVLGEPPNGPASIESPRSTPARALPQAEANTPSRPREGASPARVASDLDLDDLYGPAWVALPRGTFAMGSNDGGNDEQPVHRVVVSAFRISRFPITNRQYLRFVREAKAKAPSHWSGRTAPLGKEDHPVTNVSWRDATAFCAWLSERLSPAQGGEVGLPTEAQWEYAASGSEGRLHPWGEDEPTADHANYSNDLGDTSRVGAYAKGATPEGVHDLAGNVWEWCRDWYGPYAEQPQTDPSGPATGSLRVLRGGSFNRGPRALRSAYRDHNLPGYSDVDIGFRVAWSLAGGQK